MVARHRSLSWSVSVANGLPTTVYLAASTSDAQNAPALGHLSTTDVPHFGVKSLVNITIPITPDFS